MRNFGFVLILAGVAGFLYCSAQMEGLTPLAENADLADYYRNASGRMELGRFASAFGGLIGLIMAFFPKGR